MERQPEEAGHQHRLQREGESRRRQQAGHVGDGVERDDPRRLGPVDTPLRVEPVAHGGAGHHREGQGVGERVAEEGRVGDAAERQPPAERGERHGVVAGQGQEAQEGGGEGEEQPKGGEASELVQDLGQRVLLQLRAQHEHRAGEEQHAHRGAEEPPAGRSR